MRTCHNIGHYARAVEENLTGRVIQKTGAGILPVDIVREDNGYKIFMTQGQISFGDILRDETLTLLIQALKIKPEALQENFPVQIVSTGHSKVMVGIQNTELLHRLSPDMEKLKELSQIIDCNGFYVFTMNTQEKDILIHGRMFAPAIGINEDPVTGNANGPLGAYLVHHRKVKHDGASFSFKAMQGEAIKRAGIMDVYVKIEAHEPVEVKIAGHAVIAFKDDLTMA